MNEGSLIIGFFSFIVAGINLVWAIVVTISIANAERNTKKTALVLEEVLKEIKKQNV